MDILEAIYGRRSVREFTSEEVPAKDVTEILNAGSWAPSGLNNQPWRFVVVRDESTRRSLAGFTKYSSILLGAPLAVAVFADREAMYHEIKDFQGIGACIQNILLAAHGLGLGAVWLGEILKNSEKVKDLLGVGDNLELMAVVAVGRPAERQRSSRRKPLTELVVKEL